MRVCEVGFSAMIGNKVQKKATIVELLAFEITEIAVDIGAVINRNRKQTHTSYT